MRSGEYDRETPAVYVNTCAVRRGRVRGIPRDDDMVKSGRIPEDRAARIRVVRIPSEKKLVGSVESEFRSRADSGKGSEKILQNAELGSLRPKTHRPSREISA